MYVYLSLSLSLSLSVSVCVCVYYLHLGRRQEYLLRPPVTAQYQIEVQILKSQHTVILHSKYTSTLTFQNFHACQLCD
jgi:hypothetical protein